MTTTGPPTVAKLSAKHNKLLRARNTTEMFSPVCLVQTALLFVTKEHLNTQQQKLLHFFESGAKVTDWVRNVFSILCRFLPLKAHK